MGASCTGLCLTLSQPILDQRLLLERIWEREMWTGVYRPEWVALQIPGGTVSAVAFLVQPTHPQFAGGLDKATQARYIREARGQFGSCIAYLEQTVLNMMKNGCADQDLEELLVEARKAG